MVNLRLLRQVLLTVETGAMLHVHQDWPIYVKTGSFLAEEKLGVIKVNQCEVTYVNHIVSGEGWQNAQPPAELPQ